MLLDLVDEREQDALAVVRRAEELLVDPLAQPRPQLETDRDHDDERERDGAAEEQLAHGHLRVSEDADDVEHDRQRDDRFEHAPREQVPHAEPHGDVDVEDLVPEDREAERQRDEQEEREEHEDRPEGVAVGHEAPTAEAHRDEVDHVQERVGHARDGRADDDPPQAAPLVRVGPSDEVADDRGEPGGDRRDGERAIDREVPDEDRQVPVRDVGVPPPRLRVFHVDEQVRDDERDPDRVEHVLERLPAARHSRRLREAHEEVIDERGLERAGRGERAVHEALPPAPEHRRHGVEGALEKAEPSGDEREAAEPRDPQVGPREAEQQPLGEECDAEDEEDDDTGDEGGLEGRRRREGDLSRLAAALELDRVDFARPDLADAERNATAVAAIDPRDFVAWLEQPRGRAARVDRHDVPAAPLERHVPSDVDESVAVPHERIRAEGVEAQHDHGQRAQDPRKDALPRRRAQGVAGSFGRHSQGPRFEGRL